MSWVAAVGGEDGEDGEAISLVRRWRALGVPAQLPAVPPAALYEMTPEEGARWVAAGFDLDGVGVLHGLALETAIAWRDAGFAPRVVCQLLHADRTLTPDEAVAFDTAGIGPKDRIRWIEAGFDASTGRAWADRGVLPNEARVWRAEGLSPDDADSHTGQRLPPAAEVGWTSYGSDPASREYGVTDPPGTRGSIAYEHQLRSSR